MKNLFAIAGLLLSVSNPAGAAIDTSDTQDYTNTPNSKVSCQHNVIQHKALTVEIEISCGSQSAVFVYSPIEKLFCDPKLHCQRNLGILTKTWFGNNHANIK